MELHLDVDAAVAEYIEETGLAGHLSAFLSQVIFRGFFCGFFRWFFLVYERYSIQYVALYVPTSTSGF